MPTLSIHLPSALDKKLRKTAKRLKQKPAQFARRAIEHELAQTSPAVTMGFMKGTATIAADYDPTAPVIPLEDWGQ